MFQTDRSISLANAEKNFHRSVCGSYYSALSYIIIHKVFVLFTLHCLREIEVIWFHTLVSDQSVSLNTIGGRWPGAGSWTEL